MHQPMPEPDGYDDAYEREIEVTPEERGIWVGDWLIDGATGEVLGRAMPNDGRFHVTDDDSADWVLEKMQEVECEINALEIRKRTVVENITKMQRELERRQAWLKFRFEADLKAWAEANLPKGKRSKQLPHGALKFRKKAGRVVITDKDAALTFATQNHPQAVKVEYRVNVSELPKGREWPLESGVAWEPESESFAIDL